MTMKRREFLRRSAVGSGLALGTTSIATTTPAAAHTGGSLSPSGYTTINGAKEAVVGDDGVTVYVAVSDGFAVVDASTPAEPEVLTTVQGIPETTATNVNDLHQVYDVSLDGDTLAVAGPAHTGVSQAVVFYDVSSPSDPTETGVYIANRPIHNVELHNDVAYLATIALDESYLEIVDVEGENEVLSQWDPTHTDRGWSDVETAVRQVHDVTVRGETAYVPCWDAGTWVLDVSSPEDPVVSDHIVGVLPGEVQQNEKQSSRDMIYELPGNHHYAVPIPDSDLVIVGKEAWELSQTSVSLGSGGIGIYDLSRDRDNRQVASIAPPETPDPSTDGVFTTAHNFGLRGDRLYTSWYRGGVRVYDISDASEPVLIGEWADPAEASFWTAVPFNGGFVASSQRRVGEPREGVQRSHAPADAEGRLYVFPEPSASSTTPSQLFEEQSSESGGLSLGAAVGVVASVGGVVSWKLLRRRQ